MEMGLRRSNPIPRVLGLDDDVVCRERVKQRIREGARCTHPPLIDRRKVLRYRAASLVADIAS